MSVWEFFQVILNEEDENEFRKHVILFRKILQTQNMNTLLEYFDSYVFNRCEQWSTWFRFNICGCVWLLNTTMHCESWHNFLKSHILERKSNARIDTLFTALTEAEMQQMWKYMRNVMGFIKTGADPGWLRMRGEEDNPRGIQRSRLTVPIQTPDVSFFSRKKSLNSVILTRHRLLNKYMHEEKLKAFTDDAKRMMLQHQQSIINLIRYVGPKTGPNWVQIGSKGGSKVGPRWVQGGSKLGHSRIQYFGKILHFFINRV